MKYLCPVSALITAMALSSPLQAANHREAPLTALDHKADITDFYAFVSYDDPTKVTLILDVDPLLEPSNGPTYFPFDPEILYTIKIDNNQDAVEDIAFEFRFNTEIRLPNVFTVAVGAGNGISAPANSPAPIPPGTLIVPPAITALDGAGSEGLSLRQTYTATMVKGGQRTMLHGGRTLYKVPTNAGPRTMPNYSSLVQQGIYDLDNGIKVFAGTMDDPFWIDLGATFDSLNFRPEAFDTGVPGVLSDTQDGDDTTNFAPDDVSGFNVNTIAIEVPISLLTQDGQLHGPNDPKATIGAWGATLRPKVKVLSSQPGGPSLLSSSLIQIQRMANPLFNELIIGTGFKDEFSMSQPKSDAKFADFALDPVLARVLNAVYETSFGPGTLPVPTPPRVDLLPLVQYLPPIAATGTPPGPVADLLRLNTGITATPAANRSRLGLLGGDPAGFPNGRRVSDDVVDIAARVIAGVLAPNENGVSFSGFPHNRIGDGVNTNDVPYRETFPYVANAHSGRDSRHIDPNEESGGVVLLAE
ncbi:MAG: DUF4331 domain-containing protein [Gammaproteobacteria bacterium]|nr:DUF4331 domain-containing protein [Gammaproteobacteria bacterium]MCP5196022.1 DUF4331 domain-containing protein [Gammaproteobacteria bacterium]